MLFLSRWIQGVCQDFLWRVSKTAFLWSQLEQKQETCSDGTVRHLQDQTLWHFISTPPSAGPSVTPSDPGVCEADSADQGWTGTQRHVWMMSWWCQCQAGSRYTPQNVYNSSFLSVCATVLFQWIFCFHQQLFRKRSCHRNYLPVQVIYSVLFYLFLTFIRVLCVTFSLLRPRCLINLGVFFVPDIMMMLPHWLPSSHSRWFRFIRSAWVATSHLLLSVPRRLSRFCLCVSKVIDGLFSVAVYTTLSTVRCNGEEKCQPTGQTGNRYIQAT